DGGGACISSRRRRAARRWRNDLKAEKGLRRDLARSALAPAGDRATSLGPLDLDVASRESARFICARDGFGYRRSRNRDGKRIARQGPRFVCGGNETLHRRRGCARRYVRRQCPSFVATRRN